MLFLLDDWRKCMLQVAGIEGLGCQVCRRYESGSIRIHRLYCTMHHLTSASLIPYEDDPLKELKHQIRSSRMQYAHWIETSRTFVFLSRRLRSRIQGLDPGVAPLTITPMACWWSLCFLSHSLGSAGEHSCQFLHKDPILLWAIYSLGFSVNTKIFFPTWICCED